MADARPQLAVVPGEQSGARPSPRTGGERLRRPSLIVVHRPGRRWAGLIAAAAVATVFALLFALAAFRTIIVQDQQTLDRLEAKVSEQQEYYERLRLDVARQESPANIVAAAELRLGMVPADDVTYLTPSPETVAEVDQAVVNPTDGGAATRPATGDGAAADSSASPSWPELKGELSGR